MPLAEKRYFNRATQIFPKLPSFLTNASQAIRKEIKAQGMSLNPFIADNAKSQCIH